MRINGIVFSLSFTYLDAERNLILQQGQLVPSKKRKITEILTGLNMLETSSFHLTTKKDQFIKMGINEKNIKNFIEVEESKTEYNILRKNLTHYSLKIF